MKSAPLLFRVLGTVQKLPLAFWMLLLIALPIGAGSFGIWSLSHMENGECQIAGTLIASDSMRLYCAQLLADQPTANDLAGAIQLANAISLDHPLRADGDRLIQQWSSRLLELAENTFNEGKLDEAIKLAQEIPEGIALHSTAATRISEWRATWNQGEKISEDTQTALQEDKLSIALVEARKLLKLKNQYWNTMRFQELVNQIQASKEDKKKQAERDRKQELALAKRSSSADDLIASWQKEQAGEAAARLVKAQRLASRGDVNSVKEAIGEAEQIFSGAVQYAEAQRLITNWSRQVEVSEDRPYLEKAIALANKGDIASLQAAISEANNIYFGRALYREAQSNIDQWTAQVSQLYDQQYSRELPPNTGKSTRDTDYQIPPTTPKP